MSSHQRALPTNPWIVVLLCFAALSITASARQSVAIMTDDWVQNLGWSKTFIGSGQSVAFIIIALVSPVSGGLVDRYDVRILLTGGMSLVALGLMGFAAFPNSALYVIGYGLVGGIGIALASMHVMSAAIARLIDDRRGLAIGIADSGSTVGQVITVPLLTIALAWFSWRWGLLFMGLACLMMAVLIWIVLKPAKPIHGQSHTASDKAEGVGPQLKALLLSPVFHILFWSFFICGVTTTGAIETHFLPRILRFSASASLWDLWPHHGIEFCGHDGGWLPCRQSEPATASGLHLSGAINLFYRSSQCRHELRNDDTLCHRLWHF